MNAYQVNNFLPRDSGLTEFSDSIKKDCYSVTQFNQFFGSIPKRSSSLRPSVLSQFPRLIPASDAADSNCVLSSGVILIWKVGDNPFPFSVLSLFGVDMYVRNLLVCCLLCTYINMKYVQNKTPLNDITSITQGLTTSDTKTIEVAMQDHITPLTGRNSHTQNIVFIWRFAECQQNKATYHLVIAHTENEARSMLPNLSLVFTARIRVGGTRA